MRASDCHHLVDLARRRHPGRLHEGAQADTCLVGEVCPVARDVELRMRDWRLFREPFEHGRDGHCPAQLDREAHGLLGGVRKVDGAEDVREERAARSNGGRVRRNRQDGARGPEEDLLRERAAQQALEAAAAVRTQDDEVDGLRDSLLDDDRDGSPVRTTTSASSPARASSANARRAAVTSSIGGRTMGIDDPASPAWTKSVPKGGTACSMVSAAPYRRATAAA